jgi:hypothetical protein
VIALVRGELSPAVAIVIGDNPAVASGAIVVVVAGELAIRPGLPVDVIVGNDLAIAFVAIAKAGLSVYPTV